MTKADVLSGCDKIRICTYYINNGEKTEEVPFDHNSIGEADYIEIKGWKEDISSIREYDKLPSSLKEYILIIEKETGLPVTIVSVGPDRDQTISRY